MAAPLVQFKNVSFAAGDGRPLLEDISLELYGGQRVLITAPVASGKSALLRLMAGLARPDGGTVLVFGEDVSLMDAGRLNLMRTRMGLVFQDTVLVSNLKVIENVALPMLYHTHYGYEESLERARELLELAGFRADPWSLPDPLPLYAKREAALARALSLGPQIVACENIWEGLTGQEKASLSELLLKYHESAAGRLLIITSASEAEAGLAGPGRHLRIEGNRITEASR